MWTINGILCMTEEDVRNYCRDYTTKGFKQDFRLVSGANTLPIGSLIELLDRLGHDVVREA
jgi:hypothetical protein